jgi:hypothetical protein
MSQTQSDLSQTFRAAKKTKIKLTTRPLSAEPWVDFIMDAYYPNGGGQQVGDKLKFDEDEGAFRLEFDLVDDTGLGLAFYLDPAEAIWAAVGTDKPVHPGFADGAITPVSVSDKKLVVINDNWVAQSINFILRFTGKSMDSGTPPYILDPLIVNGGGGNNLR